MRNILSSKFSKFLPFAALAISLFIYTRYFSNLTFGDEFDKFMVSWLVKSNYVPYQDFFWHHFPILMFLSFPIEFLGHSLLFYRVFILILTFCVFLFSMTYLKGTWKIAAYFFTLIASFAISFYSGQQLADGTFWSLLILSAFIIVLKKDGQAFFNWEVVTFGILFFLTLFSSPLHMSAFLLLLAYHWVRSYQMNGIGMLAQELKNLKKMFLVVLSFSCILFVYFIVSGSLIDFWQDTLVYNSNYFYFRLYTPVLGVPIFDVWFHIVWDLFHHVIELIQKEGSHLIIFLKSLKGFLQSGFDSNYFRLIFREFYGNFFSFEMFIALFYFGAFITFLFQKKFLLTLLLMFLLFALRARIDTAVHRAPYYLFSYFLLACTLAIYTQNIFHKKKVMVNLLAFVFVAGLFMMFVVKNWQQFEQIAFNRFVDDNKNTVAFLSSCTNQNEKILVFSDRSSSYYWQSKRQNVGKFVNYFAWYDHSPELQREMVNELVNYNGRILILPRREWERFESKGEVDEWKRPYFLIVRGLYTKRFDIKNDSIFSKDKISRDLDVCKKNLLG